MKAKNQTPHTKRTMTYQITVNGRLDESWSEWFEGMAFTFDKLSDGSDVTILTGEVVDQAALHGVLSRIRDLNIPLQSVLSVRSSTDLGVTNNE